MFFYSTTAPDGSLVPGRSNTPAPFKVLALVGNVYDSFASASTIHGARIAADIWRNRAVGKVKKSITIAEAKEITRAEWELLNDEHRARLIADLTKNN